MIYTIKDLLSILDELDTICIITEDYCKLYYGRIMNIPEKLLNCMVVNNSLSVNVDDSNYPYFVVKVR